MPRTSYPAPIRPYITLPDGWDTVWKAARATNTTTPAWITFIGDSIFEGVNASDPTTTDVVSLIRASLLNGATPYADFYAAYGNSAINLFAGTPPWSAILNAVATTTDAASGWTRTTYNSGGSTAVAHQQFTLPYTCTSIDLVYIDRWSGTFQYKVGAAGNVTVTANVAGNNRNLATVKRINITGTLTAGTVIQYGWASAAGPAQVLGITCYGASTGLGFGRCVANNAGMNDFNDVSVTYPYGHVNLFGGPTLSANVQGGAPQVQPPVSAPGAALVTASGNIDAGTHKWAYTQTGIGGESGLSPITGSLTTDGTHAQVNLTSIAVGNAAFNVTDRTVYRTKAGTTTPYFKVAALGNNSATTFTDNVADVSLTVQAPSTTTPNTLTWGNFGFPMNPHLAVIALSVNDQNGSITQAVFEQQATRMVSALRRGRPNCSILFVVCMYPDMDSSDLYLYLTNPGTYYLMQDAIKNVARNMNCAVVDFHAKWQNSPLANSYIPGTSGIHPGDVGFADMANTIIPIL